MSSSASALFRRHWLDTLLSLVPASLALEAYGGDPLWVFGAAGLPIVPLAGWMGRATEHLASRLGEGIGGLLNATFGNAAELIIALFALREGLHEVVKASITGSIIGNVLLVLGLSMVAGGMRYTVQDFNRSAASMGASLLLLSAIGLVVPTVFHALGPGAADERGLSLEIALVLFATYLLSLLFSLRTHRHLYVGEESEGADEHPSAWSQRRSFGILMLTSGLIAVMFGTRHVGMLFGFVFLSHQIGAFVGVWLGGAVYERTGAYDLMWVLSIVLGLAAAVVHLPIHERRAPRWVASPA